MSDSSAKQDIERKKSNSYPPTIHSYPPTIHSYPPTVHLFFNAKVYHFHDNFKGMADFTFYISYIVLFLIPRWVLQNKHNNRVYQHKHGLLT